MLAALLWCPATLKGCQLFLLLPDRITLGAARTTVPVKALETTGPEPQDSPHRAVLHPCG